MRPTRFGATVAVGLTAAVLVTAVEAQVLPGPVDPGRVDERLQTPVRPTSRPPLELLSEDLAPPPALAGIIKFDFTDLVIEGGGVRIEIVEGYVSETEITGASDDVAADIRGCLASILAVVVDRTRLSGAAGPRPAGAPSRSTSRASRPRCVPASATP